MGFGQARTGDCEVTDGNVVRSSLGWGIANNEAAPCFVTLVDDLSRVFFVLGFAGESKCVLALAIGNLVDPEPLVGGPDEARQVTLDVFDIVELWGEGVMDIDDDDFPVSLAFVEQGHDAEDLDLFHLTNVANLFADLADIKRVIVTLCLCLCMSDVWVLPGLWEGTIVPDVAVMGEAVANEAQAALFGILFDGVEGLLFGYFHLGVGPTGDLDDHVEDAIVPVGEKRDVVEGRDDLTVSFSVDPVIEGVGCADETRCILGSHGRSG